MKLYQYLLPILFITFCGGGDKKDSITQSKVVETNLESKDNGSGNESQVQIEETDNSNLNQISNTDYLFHYNNKIHVQLGYTGKPNINNLVNFRKFDIKGNMFLTGTFKKDKRGRVKYDSEKLIIPEGDIIYHKNGEGISLNKNILEILNTFWGKSTEEFYDDQEVSEKILKRFENGDTRELIRYITINNKKIPVERMEYFQSSKNTFSEGLFTGLKTHQKLLGFERRTREYKQNIDATILLSDRGIFSDDLILLGYNHSNKDLLISELTYGFKPNYKEKKFTNNIETLRILNYKEKYSFSRDRSEHVYVENTSQDFFDVYSGTNLESLGLKTLRLNKNPLSKDFRRQSFNDELKDDTFPNYHDYYKNREEYNIFEDKTRLILLSPSSNRRREISVRDSLNNLNQCPIGIDEIYVYYDNPTQLPTPRENIKIEYSSLQNIENELIYGKIYHPNGKLMTELSLEFKDEKPYSYNNDCKEKIYPYYILNRKFYSDDGRFLGEGKFDQQNYGSKIPNHIIFDFEDKSKLSDNLLSGNNFKFFYSPENLSKNFTNGNYNPVTSITTKTNNSMSISIYDFEKTRESYDNQYNEWKKNFDVYPIKKESLIKKSLTNYIFSGRYYPKKNGMEIIYGNEGVIIEEIEWKDGKKVEF